MSRQRAEEINKRVSFGHPTQLLTTYYVQRMSMYSRDVFVAGCGSVEADWLGRLGRKPMENPGCSNYGACLVSDFPAPMKLWLQPIANTELQGGAWPGRFNR